jgi:hypothetical protein
MIIPIKTSIVGFNIDELFGTNDQANLYTFITSSFLSLSVLTYQMTSPDFLEI